MPIALPDATELPKQFWQSLSPASRVHTAMREPKCWWSKKPGPQSQFPPCVGLLRPLLAAVFCVFARTFCHRIGYADDRSNGSLRNRLPVSAATALAIAGAIAGTPGSPRPVGGSTLGTKYTATGGASVIRGGG